MEFFRKLFGRQETVDYLAIATAQLGRKQYAEAIENFTILIQAKPHLLSGYEGRAFARSQLGDLEGALADCGAVLRLRPRFAHGYVRRSGLYFTLGKYADAMQDVEKALAFEPQNVWGLIMRGQLRQRQGGP